MSDKSVDQHPISVLSHLGPLRISPVLQTLCIRFNFLPGRARIDLDIFQDMGSLLSLGLYFSCFPPGAVRRGHLPDDAPLPLLPPRAAGACAAVNVHLGPSFSALTCLTNLRIDGRTAPSEASSIHLPKSFSCLTSLRKMVINKVGGSSGIPTLPATWVLPGLSIRDGDFLYQHPGA